MQGKSLRERSAGPRVYVGIDVCKAWLDVYLHPLIREQAFGEALDPDKLERLARYEVHLDRKLERTLSMLLKLKDLRQGTTTE